MPRAATTENEIVTMNSVMTKRNREKFVHDGHMFTFERLNASRTVKFWRCDRRDSYDCKARIHTSVATNEAVKEVNTIPMEVVQLKLKLPLSAPL
uniref:FLYWCH-type domain-containing protein n=1 Tax=Trichuris muris TaxID=70415 RepID=A0A5S6Q2H3_TRIMR